MVPMWHFARKVAKQAFTCQRKDGTNVKDGAVSFPLTSTGLADYAWFMLKW